MGAPTPGSATPDAKATPQLRDQFRSPAPEFRPIVRWWWFGVSVNNDELERELVQMRDAGFGGVEIQPVSPSMASAGEPPHNLPFLSQEFLDALAFAIAKAKTLGLTVDIVLGSGWPLGGPNVKPEHGARKLGRESSKWPAGVPTREQPKAGAIGAEGLVLDPYDHSAVAEQLRVVGEKLLAAVDKTALHAVFSDRLDMVAGDWTADFIPQFNQRRGYDVGNQLYSLSSSEADTAELRHDFAWTLSELLDERYFAQMQEFSHRHRILLRGQTGGSLPATLSSARFMDLPEGEGLPWNGLVASRWASSVAHLYGKAAASAQVWRYAPPTFRASPLDLKVDADQAFLAGANYLVGQGWPYSPPQASGPGWVFDATAAVNAHNPWWPVMPELTLYLRRTSFVLRQGEAMNDVAIYLPTHDALATLAPGNVDLAKAITDRVGPDLVPAVLRAGYGCDLVDDSVIQNLAATGGKVLKVGRQAYGVVILPNVERIPLATLEKFEAFVAGGGTLIATRRIPVRLPNQREAQESSQRLTAKLDKLFASNNPPAKLVRDETGELGSVLRKSIEPDLRTAMVAPQIGFVHRRAGELDLYFIVNTSNLPYDNAIELRVPPHPAEWWDAMTGELTVAPPLSSTATSTKVRLALPPYASKILVFGMPGRGRPMKSATRNTDEPLASLDLTMGWDVTFEGTNISRHVDSLSSWTESADTRSFSGEAVYRKTVTITQPKLLAARRPVLSLGEAKSSSPGPSEKTPRALARLDAPVNAAAVVFINGQRAGAVWQPPYEIQLEKLLRDGENKIEIRVFNLGANQFLGRPRVAQGRPEGNDPFEDTRVPMPSGLFGPVTITAAE
jgi:hypothetical protein